MQSLSRRCPTDVSVRVVPLPPRIRSFMCEKDNYITICINEALSDDAKRRAYEHELWHLEHDDLHSDLPTGLIEIRAHEQTK